MSSVKKLITYVTVFLMLFCLSACNKNEDDSTSETADITTSSHRETTEEQTTEKQTTEEEIVYNEFTDFYLVDYAVLAGILENHDGTIAGAVISDSNEDGIGDLFVSITLPETSTFFGRQTYYAFSDVSNPVCEIHTATYAPQSNFMGVYDGDKVYLENDYAAMTNGSISYSEWDYGWINTAKSLYSTDENYNHVFTYHSADGIISADEYDSIIEKYSSFTPIPDNINDIKHISIENADYGAVVTDYEKHLKKSHLKYIYKDGDIDCDGMDEACFFVCDYAGPWRNNLWSYANLDEECFVNGGENYVTLVYIDEEGTDTSFKIRYLQELNELSDVVIDDIIDVYDSYNYVHEYETIIYGNTLNLNKIYYNGSIEEALYSQTFYSPDLQSPSWSVYNFSNNGKCVRHGRMMDTPDLYGETYYDFTFEPSTNTLTLYSSDGYVTVYTYNEEYAIFEAAPVDISYPFEDAYYVRPFIVALPGTPMSEEYSYYGQFHYYEQYP